MQTQRMTQRGGEAQGQEQALSAEVLAAKAKVKSSKRALSMSVRVNALLADAREDKKLAAVIDGEGGADQDIVATYAETLKGNKYGAIRGMMQALEEKKAEAASGGQGQEAVAGTGTATPEESGPRRVTSRPPPKPAGAKHAVATRPVSQYTDLGDLINADEAAARAQQSAAVATAAVAAPAAEILEELPESDLEEFVEPAAAKPAATDTKFLDLKQMKLPLAKPKREGPPPLPKRRPKTVVLTAEAPQEKKKQQWFGYQADNEVLFSAKSTREMLSAPAPQPAGPEDGEIDLAAIARQAREAQEAQAALPEYEISFDDVAPKKKTPLWKKALVGAAAAATLFAGAFYAGRVSTEDASAPKKDNGTQILPGVKNALTSMVHTVTGDPAKAKKIETKERAYRVIPLDMPVNIETDGELLPRKGVTTVTRATPVFKAKAAPAQEDTKPVYFDPRDKNHNFPNMYYKGSSDLTQGGSYHIDLTPKQIASGKYNAENNGVGSWEPCSKAPERCPLPAPAAPGGAK